MSAPNPFGIDDIDDLLPDRHELPSRMLEEPSRTITPVRPSDPARLGYPPTLPIEIALRTSSTRDICEEYGISEDEWDLIRVEPLFLDDLARAVAMLKEDGMSFKLKAQLQASELLKTNWRIIHDPTVPPSVRAQQINAVVRWAGHDVPPSKDGGTTGPGFSISINFNGSAKDPRIING